MKSITLRRGARKGGGGLETRGDCQGEHVSCIIMSFSGVLCPRFIVTGGIVWTVAQCESHSHGHSQALWLDVMAMKQSQRRRQGKEVSMELRMTMCEGGPLCEDVDVTVSLWVFVCVCFNVHLSVSVYIYTFLKVISAMFLPLYHILLARWPQSSRRFSESRLSATHFCVVQNQGSFSQMCLKWVCGLWRPLLKTALVNQIPLAVEMTLEYLGVSKLSKQMRTRKGERGLRRKGSVNSPSLHTGM